MTTLKELSARMAPCFLRNMGDPVTYNGVELTAIYESGEGNVKQNGTSDHDAFWVSKSDVTPQINDEIVYDGKTYSVKRIGEVSGVMIKVEVDSNKSVYPRGRTNVTGYNRG